MPRIEILTNFMTVILMLMFATLLTTGFAGVGTEPGGIAAPEHELSLGIAPGRVSGD